MLSVIIPVYNVEKYLRRCLDSVLNQTYRDLEIICVNDGSTDSSLSILEEYTEKDSRIKIISQENGGLSAARNSGLKRASGDYITFLDSDDWIEEETYVTALKYFSTNIDSVCFAAKTVPDSTDGSVFDNATAQYYHRIRHNGPIKLTPQKFYDLTITVWNKIYKKSIIDKYNLDFPEGLIHEDFSFYTKYMAVAPNTYFVNEYLYNYLQRNSSIMQSNSNLDTTHLTDCIKNFLNTYEFFKANTLIQTKELILVQMFKECVCEDYRNAHKNNKIKVLEFATKVAKDLDIGYNWNTNGFIKNIKKKRYYKIENLNIKNPFRHIFSLEKKHNQKILEVLWMKFIFEKREKQIPSITQTDFDSLLLDNIYSIQKNLLKRKIDEKYQKNIKKPVAQQILKAVKELNNFYFFPNNGNLGDIVIAESEYQFLNDNNIDYEIFDINKQQDLIGNKDFNLVYGGGGLFVKYWNYEREKEIFKKPNLKKAVILSASFNECDDLLGVLDERFTVFCREKKSYDYCISKNKKAKFYLADDMAFGIDLNRHYTGYTDSKKLLKNTNEISDDTKLYLYKDIYPAYKRVFKKTLNDFQLKVNIKNDKKIGYFLRTDEEKRYDNSLFPSIDISLFACSSCIDSGIVSILSKLFIKAIDTVDIVVTDRLHVGLIATLLGKQTLLLDNSYGKVSGIYNHSMTNFTNVKLLNDINDVKKELNILKYKDLPKSKDLNSSDMLSFEEFLQEYLSSAKEVNNVYNTIWE